LTGTISREETLDWNGPYPPEEQLAPILFRLRTQRDPQGR
jgi:hypothetical protein